MSRKKKPRTFGPIEPPLVPLSATVNSLPGPPIVSVTVRHQGDFPQTFAAYVAKAPANLDVRPVGTWAHLQAAYQHATMADEIPRKLARIIKERGGDSRSNARANDAGVNLLVAAHLLNSASLLHVRPDSNTHAHGLILSRSALEATGRAALIATGAEDEVARWRNGTTISAKECIHALRPVLQQRQPTAALATTVYDWMCHFTHMNCHGVRLLNAETERNRDDSYCGYAFAAWAAAAVAELITGLPNLAHYPSPLVEPLPWDRPLQTE